MEPAADREPLWIAAPACLRSACFSLPAVRALASNGPVRILAPAGQEALWESSGVGGVVTAATQTREIARQLGDCRRILLWEAGPAADAAAKARVPHRTGLPARGLTRRLTHLLERVIHPGPPEHQVRGFLDVAALLGAPPPDARHFDPLPAPVPRRETTLLLDPGSDFGPHFEWPLERWSELLERLAPDPSRCAVVASSPAIATWAREASLSTVDAGDLLPLTAAGLMISVENRRIHLAAAFGTRCAVLYGPGDPALHRPLGKHHAAIRRKAECAPCFAPRCPLDLRCQRELTAEFVADRLAALVKAS